MEIGMIGLGRMGSSMVRRLLRARHQCVVYDIHPETVLALVQEGAVGATSLEDFVQKLTQPRAVWMMVPAAVVDHTLNGLVPLLERDDVVIDGGNSYYHDDIRRDVELQPKGIHYVDVGTSGGVWGMDRGYCLMIGGDETAVQRLDPIFAALAPGIETAPRTPGREKVSGTSEHGYLHCGPAGAGHFVKMVHNGIEYGVMAAYAEGLNILHHANAGKQRRTADAETTPLRHPEYYQYDLNLAGVSELTEPGTNGHHLCYSAGVMVLSKEHPRVIRHRSTEPVLTPLLPQERHGIVPNVVFPTGIDRRDDLGLPDRFDVYYGMADNRIGVARLDVPERLPPRGTRRRSGPRFTGPTLARITREST